MSSDNPEPPSTSRIYILGFRQSVESEGKCFSCGFLWLGLPAKAEPDYREADWRKRLGMDNYFDRIDTDKGESLHPMLECLLGLRNIHGEIGAEASRQRSDFEKAALVVLKKDIKCPKWQPYNPGKSIQQYYAEEFMQRLEELRQRFQRDGEEQQRAFESSMAETHARLQEQTNRIVEAILATTKDHKDITEKSKRIAENSLTVEEGNRRTIEVLLEITKDSKEITESSKKVAEASLIAVTESKKIAGDSLAIVKASDKFTHHVDTWLIILTVLTLLGMALQIVLQVRFANRPQPPIIIQQQPAESSPKQENGTAK